MSVIPFETSVVTAETVSPIFLKPSINSCISSILSDKLTIPVSAIHNSYFFIKALNFAISDNASLSVTPSLRLRSHSISFAFSGFCCSHSSKNISCHIRISLCGNCITSPIDFPISRAIRAHKRIKLSDFTSFLFRLHPLSLRYSPLKLPAILY